MLEDIKVNKDRYYTVGYCPYLKQYMLAITDAKLADILLNVSYKYKKMT